MLPRGFHLVFRARDSRVLAPDTAAQRILAVTTHRIGERYGLYAFRASGDHLHTANLCDRAEAGHFAQCVSSALTQALSISGGFAPTFVKPMADQFHLEEVFRYVHRNAEKHGVANDPTHEASSIQALLGLRLAPPGFIPRVRALVPRAHRGQLLAMLGVGELVPAMHLDLLADAAAGAVGLAKLDDSTPARRARHAAIRLALPTTPLAAVADALALSERSLRRYRAAEADPALENIIALRMGHRAALGDRARIDLPPGDRR
ncbi:MAG: hypothetical protein V4850_25280 [Myxococcota bacterium]